MKVINICLSVLILLGGYQPAIAQSFTSTYMKLPNKAFEVILNEADFWAQYQDNTYGGFINEVDRYGNFSATSQKSFASNSRLAYAFTRAFMVTGEFQYLVKARHAMNFLYDHGWDNANDGWYYAANYDGTNPQHNIYNDGKWSYMQHYGMLGTVAINEATNGTITWNDGRESDQTWLYRSLNSVNNHLWDNSPGLEGYFDIANNDWSNPHNKGFTPTADGLTTHATVMALRDVDDFYEERFFTLADRVANNIIPANYTSGSPLIYEYSDSYWQPFGQELFNGHAVKCAWNLARAYMIDPTRTIYKQKAEQILDELLARGYYDNQYGGIHYFQTSGQKSHWTQEQGILAGILMSFITDNPAKRDAYLAMADGCWKFMEDYMIDLQNGGSLTDVNQNGTPSSSFGKGDYWEAGYHTTETAYYTYLYSNIYLRNNSVTLYYYFEPKGGAQIQKLTPFAIEDTKLIIQDVELNGQTYNSFNSETRELNIAANEGGIFKVKFRYNPDYFICPYLSLGSDRSICDEGTVTLDPGLYADGYLEFTWYKDGNVIQGPDFSSNTLTVTESGTYQLDITGPNCDKSDVVIITDDIPAFTLGTDFAYTSPTTLSTGITGNYTHTWYKNGSVITGEASNSLTITGEGYYSVDVSSACGTSTASIMVFGAPHIPFTVNPVTIDGAQDASYITNYTADNYVLNSTNSTDLSGNWTAAWNNQYLYVLVNVTDDNLSNDGGNWWDNDGVEIYIDGDNSKNTSYDRQNDFQWGFLWNSNTIQTGGSNPAGSTNGIIATHVTRANGYTYEIAIPWTTIGITPAGGNNIGLEIGINDDDFNGSRDHKIMWYATVDDSWQNPSLFANIELTQGEPNLVPIANAGNDLTLELPVGNFSLIGSASSGDGILTYNWTTNSSAIISGATTLIPTISGITAAGIYNFTLVVTDEDGDIGIDQVTITVTEPPIPVTGVTIDQSNIVIEQQQIIQLTATVLPTNATNKNISWSSSSTNIATVSNSGLITGINPGEVTITATTLDGSYTDQITITVLEADIAPIANAGIDITRQLPISTIILTGYATGGNGTLTYLWTTNASLTISNATSLTPTISGFTNSGTFTITLTATDSDGDTHSDNMVITVTPAPVAVIGVVIDQSNVEINVGQLSQITATVLPVNAANQNISWSSSNTSIVSIMADGTVVGEGEGSATITVTTQDGGYTDQLVITVLPQTVNCEYFAKPTASNWIILNDWNDGAAGSGFSNNTESLIFSHRSWGNNNAFLVQTGIPIVVEAGETYTITFDVLDADNRLNEMKVGMCTGSTWNAPTNYVAPLTDVSPGYPGNYITKSVTLTANGNSNSAYLVLYLSVSTEMITQHYLFKNIEICGNNTLKSGITIQEELETENKAINVFPNPATNFATISLYGMETMDVKMIEISNSTGQVIETLNGIGNTFTLNTEHYPAGIYFIKANNCTSTITIIK